MTDNKQGTLNLGKEISRRDLLKKVLPLGKVTLDGSCTTCGLCASVCPTGALDMVRGDGAASCRLLFRHGRCIACGNCVEVCPEKCLSLERTLVADRLVGPAGVLFEDEIVRCSRCGTPFASRSMLAKIRSKMNAASEIAAKSLEICPECKAKFDFYRMGQ
jgi:ferredoxin